MIRFGKYLLSVALFTVCFLVFSQTGKAGKGSTLLQAKLTILRELDALEARSYEDEQKARKLELEVQEIEKRAASIRSKVAESKDATTEAKERIAKLLHLSSILKRQMGVDVLLAGADLQRNLRARRLSAQLAVGAAHRVNVYLDREVALKELEAGLEHVSAHLKERLAELELRRQEADKSKKLFVESLAQLRDDPRLQAALRKESGEIQSSLQASVARYESWRDSREKFSSLKSKLRMPFVPSQVVNPFGVPDKEATNSAALVHRGVVIQLDNLISVEGVSVRSIAWGRVGFSGNIPGYGPTVVVDHGMGYHGVYAGFQELKVEEGSVVKPREAVGFFRPAKTKPKIVFELWKDGVPVDPSPWFQ